MSKIPFYAKRFVAGLDMNQAADSVAELNQKNISATLDCLGENITEKDQATHFTQEYLNLIKLIAEKNVDSHVSVKPTMLGLDIDETFCYENLASILKEADKHNNRVALDMEGSDYTERTMVLYEALAKDFKSPEIVLQAYLHRTEQDIERVLKSNGRLRLCKGAYKETKEVALQKMSDIVENYNRLLSKLLLEGQRVCIASHDDNVIDFAKSFISQNNIPKERYEFQMLFGMRSKTWDIIASEGHNMTVYVPYGDQWQAYFARRVAERKENVFFVLKNMFRK